MNEKYHRLPELPLVIVSLFYQIWTISCICPLSSVVERITCNDEVSRSIRLVGIREIVLRFLFFNQSFYNGCYIYIPIENMITLRRPFDPLLITQLV